MIATSQTNIDSYVAKSTQKIDLERIVDAFQHYIVTGEISTVLKDVSFPKGYKIAQFEDSEGSMSLVSESISGPVRVTKGDEINMPDSWMYRFHEKWMEEFVPKPAVKTSEEPHYVSIAEIRAKAELGDEYMDSDDKDAMFR